MQHKTVELHYKWRNAKCDCSSQLHQDHLSRFSVM